MVLDLRVRERSGVGRIGKDLRSMLAVPPWDSEGGVDGAAVAGTAPPLVPDDPPPKSVGMFVLSTKRKLSVT